MNVGKLAFAAAVIVTASLATLIVRRVIIRLQRKRLARLDTIDRFDAVTTGSPFDDPLKVALRHAKSSVHSRYTVINRIATGGLVLLAILAASFPMLDTLPRAIVSLLVAIAAAVLGIAAKPFVENLISGVVISFSNHLRIGDTVLLEDKYYGTVEDITITHTVVKMWDWRRQVVPNSLMLQMDFTNLSHRDSYLLAYVEFQVDYEVDLDLVEKLALEAAQESSYYAPYEPPQMWVRELEPGTIKVWLAAWAARAEDAWYLRSDMRRGLATRFRKHGIRSQVQHVGLDPARLGLSTGSRLHVRPQAEPSKRDRPAEADHSQKPQPSQSGLR